jgi:hypothetical protein
MSRYRIKTVDASFDREFPWVVFDSETGMVARINGTWLEFLSEFEAERLAIELNQVEGAQ